MTVYEEYEEIQKLDQVLNLVKKYNIARLVYNGMEIENTRADPHVMQAIEKITKVPTDEDLLFKGPYVGLT